MKRLLILLLLLNSCWSGKEKADGEFINAIKQQASLDSNKRTTIQIYPRYVNFGGIDRSKGIEGFFWVKNTGNIDFNIISLMSPCGCIEIIKDNVNKIKAKDSTIALVHFFMYLYNLFIYAFSRTNKKYMLLFPSSKAIDANLPKKNPSRYQTQNPCLINPYPTN